ncbi:MAG: hypothetical protein ACYSW3_00875 [Planctomycetota bacterium]
MPVGTEHIGRNKSAAMLLYLLEGFKAERYFTVSDIDGMIAHLFIALEDVLQLQNLPGTRTGGHVSGIYEKEVARTGIREECLSPAYTAGHAAGATARLDVTARITGVEDRECGGWRLRGCA